MPNWAGSFMIVLRIQLQPVKLDLIPQGKYTLKVTIPDYY